MLWNSEKCFKNLNSSLNKELKQMSRYSKFGKSSKIINLLSSIWKFYLSQLNNNQLKQYIHLQYRS